MITLYQLKTNANARLANMGTSNARKRAFGSVCWNEPTTGPLGVNISASRLKLHFQKFANVIWSYFFFIKPYKHVISFHVNFLASSKLILTFTKRGWVACETTSVHGPQCNFRLRNTTSVHGRQLPSTPAPLRYLIHCFQHEWAKMVIKLPKASRRMLSEKTSMITTNQTMCQCLASMTSVTLIKTAWRVILMATTKHRTKLFK